MPFVLSVRGAFAYAQLSHVFEVVPHRPHLTLNGCGQRRVAPTLQNCKPKGANALDAVQLARGATWIPGLRTAEHDREDHFGNSRFEPRVGQSCDTKVRTKLLCVNVYISLHRVNLMLIARQRINLPKSSPALCFCTQGMYESLIFI